MIGWWFSFLPYPADVNTASCCWLLLSCVILVQARLRMQSRSPLRRKLGTALPLVAFVAVPAQWFFASWCYHHKVWPAFEPYGIAQWLLDGPLIELARGVSSWVLWHVFRVCGAIGPVHFFNGSSTGHAPVSVHLLCLANDAALLAVVVAATLALPPRRRG